MNGFSFGVVLFGLFAGTAPGGEVAPPGYTAPYQERPAYARFCMDSTFGPSGPATVCMYETMAQCRASRASNGDRCYLNPAFASESPRRTYRR
ncbi:MAG: DUF3551 domain-containing protein [Xanthobacteraceae bacterium]|nr:DUF3551 domain-containing protein [Xanthobacteraceae bacterium]QYK46116.1 MAG: DUF3551 domain-containing protein [Xanthobacteraceae bacterium]